MRKAFLSFLLLASLAATGCATPQVTLKDALLTKLTPKNLEIGLDLDILNPNQFAIPLSSVDWDLDLFNTDFTKGKTPFSRQIGPEQHARVRVPLGIEFRSIRVGVQSLLTKRAIPWKIAGGCSFRIPSSSPLRIGFEKSGSWRNPLMR